MMAIMIPLALAALVGIAGALYFRSQQIANGEARPMPLAVARAEPTAGSLTNATPGVGHQHRVEDAVSAFQAGDIVEARKLLAAADLDRAGSSFGWELAGLLKEQEGKMIDAMDFYSRGIAATPAEGLYYRRAILRRARGEFELALGDMDHAAALSPADIVVTNERLLLLVQMGRKEQAARELNAMNSYATDAKGRIFALIGIALENGDYSQGASLLELGKKSVPPQVFEQMLRNPVLSRHQTRPEILPFYISNLPR